MAKTIKRFSRADNGRYTTKKYADRHPNTTVKKTDKVKPREKN